MTSNNSKNRSYSKIAARLLLGASVAGMAATTSYAQQDASETVVVTGTSIRGAAPVGANVITVDRATIEASGAQTVQQLLTNVPQLTSSFGTSGQGGGNTDGGTGSFTPTIHNIGGGASIATLVLVDGHRVPGTGLTVWGVDPSLLPTNMIQRVEVLPDGASSVYGADALAGVVNFITRKDYTGWETSAQYGIADKYNTFSAGQVFGHSWDGGSVTAGYTYSNRSELGNGNRDYMTPRQDIRWGTTDPSLFTGIPATAPSSNVTGTAAATTTPAAGAGSTGPYGTAIPYPSAGTNFQNFNCPVASIANTSSADAYIYPYVAGTGLYVTTSSRPPQGVCDTAGIGSTLPSEVKNLSMVTIRQAVTDRISVNADLVYATRLDGSRSSRGTISATVFNPNGTGDAAFGTSGSVAAKSHTNPFYVGVPGASATANSEYVRYSLDDLLGAGAGSKNGSTQAFAAFGVDADLGGDWAFTTSAVFGTNTDFNRSFGGVNSSEAYLALNGTPNTNGSGNTTTASSSIIDPYGLNTIVSVTRALDTTNALDVWQPAATNRTPAAVRSSLTDNNSNSVATKSLQDVVIKFDGPLLELPAGDLKTAFGAEYEHSQQDEYGSSPSTAGPSSSSSSSYRFSLNRTAYSAFAEFIVPLISEDAGIPLVRKLTMDVSGRFDHFSDAGSTKNPKVGFTWDILDGLQARGTYGTSFVVVDIHHTGVNGTGTNSESQVNAAGTPSNPIIPFSTTSATPYNNFQGVAGTWVDTATTCAAGGGQPVNASGAILAAPYTGATGCRIAFGSTTTATQSAALSITGGNPNLKPPTGVSYSAGLDFDAGRFLSVLTGLTGNVTYYESKFAGLNTSVGTQNGRLDLTTFAPPGGWAASSAYIQGFIAGRPLRLPLPAVVWATFDGRQQNAYTLWQNGLDFSANYRFNVDDLGSFNLGISGNQILRQSQAVFGLAGAVPVDTKNGKNSPRFSTPEFQGTLNIGWRLDAIAASVSANYTHVYWATNNNFPWNLPGPNRLAGYEKIPANITVDMNLSYDLPDEWMSGTQVSMHVSNLLDSNPPRFDNANGYSTGNPIGRLITFSVRKKW